MLAIFNWDFELVNIQLSYVNFKWIRNFHKAGEFVLELPFSKETFNLLLSNPIILKRSENADYPHEACLIEDINNIETLKGDRVLIVKGRGLESLLDRRIFSHTGNITLKNLITKLLNENFIKPSNTRRKMPALRLLDFNLSKGNENLSIDTKNSNVYEFLVKLLEEHKVGVKALYNRIDKTIDISFHNLSESLTSFSKDFNNVLEQDFYYSTKAFKNVVYIDEEVFFDNNSGIDRREISTNNSKDTPNNQTALNFLNDKKIIKDLSTSIDPYSTQFEYLKDWDIGSIVLCQNRDLNLNAKNYVSTVTEFYDQKGLNLEVSLNDFEDS